MSKIYSFLIILNISFFISINSFGNYGLPKDEKKDWELILSTDGIDMFERWVNLGKNLKVRERTGKMTLRCSAEQVLKLIEDETRTPLWMCNVEKVEVLKRQSKNNWFVHTILDTPWPFDKQDMVSNYQVSKDEVTGIITILVLSEKNLLPKQKDIDRLDTFNAEWIIKPLGKDKVRVTFTTKSTRPPEYPSWMQDPVVRKIFVNNLKNFKLLLAQA